MTAPAWARNRLCANCRGYEYDDPVDSPLAGEVLRQSIQVPWPSVQAVGTPSTQTPAALSS
jgi:hypothetical protein